MLLKVSEQIAECLERAARLREQAERAGNPRMREEFPRRGAMLAQFGGELSVRGAG
jgi:hypothetical protein